MNSFSSWWQNLNTWKKFRMFIVLIWILMYSKETWLLILHTWNYFRAPDSTITFFASLPSEVALGFAEMLIQLILMAYVFGVSLLFFARFVLPVQSLIEQWGIFTRLLNYSLGMKGPAVFVSEGRIVRSYRELERGHSGIALVDTSSAIVIQNEFSRETTQEVELEGESKSSRLQSLPVKIEGPGIVFVEALERIVESVDLRKQVRSSPLILGTTRDGIELETRVNISFSITEEPDEIFLGFSGDGKENLRVIKLEENKKTRTKTVVGFVDALNEEEKNGISRFLRSSTGIKARKEGAKSIIDDAYVFVKFDQERIFSAIFSWGQVAGDEWDLGAWAQLPVTVAKDVFRTMISKWNYEELYLFDDPNKFPLLEFLKDFAIRLKVHGVVKFTLILRKDQKPFKIGQEFRADELEYYRPEIASPMRVLRNRGIKIISAGFGEVVPTSEDIFSDTKEKLHAKWDKDIELINAEKELQAQRRLTKAWIEAQQDTSYVIADFFKNHENADEALLLLLFDSLDSSSLEKNLSPNEIIDVLKYFEKWLSMDVSEEEG